MKIRIQRKKLPEWLILFILIMPLILPFCTELLGLPSMLKYTLDVAWVILLVQILLNRRLILNLHVYTLLRIVLLFFAVTLVSTLCQYQSFAYYLWGLRNNIRFFVFFFSCVFFLSMEKTESYLSFMDKVFWINFPVVLIQYFVFHKNQDYLGGIFGTEVGCNSGMNLFVAIIVARSVLHYFNHTEKLMVCLLKCVMALIIAVLSELKIFFIEFLLIVFFATSMTKFDYRKLQIIIVCIISVYIGVQAVAVIFPDFSGWFTLDGIVEILSSKKGYTGRNGINRFTAITYALNNFLPSLANKLFGLGLGNCDYAAFSFLVTPFYRAYTRTRYYWFSSSFLVVETGLIGLAIYVAFFVVLFFCVDKLEKKALANPNYCQLSKIMAVLSVVMIIYNSSLRTEAGYMAYFVLSLPFIKQKNTNTKAVSMQ